MPVKRSSPDRLDQPEFNLRLLLLDMALDLKLVLAFILIAIMVIYLPYINESVARPAIGLLIVLFVPGYALIAALFPGRSDLGHMERGALSLGLSIAVSSLIGLGLNYTPWGIKIDPLVVCLSVFTVLCVLTANMRRHVTPADERLTVSLKSVTGSIRAGLIGGSESRLDRTLSIALVAVMLISICLTIFVIFTPKHGEVFTEFYILSSNDRSDNYPVEYVLGDMRTITIGVANHEYRNVSYDISVMLRNDTGMSTLYENNLTLGNEELWEKKINLTPDRIGTLIRMDFLLYADNQTDTPYRENHLWVNVTQAGASSDSGKNLP